MIHQEKTDIEEDFEDPPEQEEVYRFFLTGKDGGERLDKVLAKHLPQFSRSRIQKWIDHGFVTVNGEAMLAKRSMVGDEEVIVKSQPAAENRAFEPEPMALEIVYEDDELIIINKPAGIVVHPAAGNWSGTLLNGLLHHFPSIAAVPRAGIVHRLDKDTTGLMVVAKTLIAQTSLVKQLQERTVSREYIALVWGVPLLKQTINASIGRHPRDRVRMAVSDRSQAKHAVTHYERIATGKINSMNVSLLKCKLETGRTHQIRVHMQSLGFPLVGDPAYGKPHLASVFGRQALHAEKLGFVHPISHLPCEWQAPVPDDFAALLDEAGITEYAK